MLLGLNLITTAGNEPDLMRKDELVNKAIECLMFDPTRFDIQSVVPSLVKNK